MHLSERLARSPKKHIELRRRSLASRLEASGNSYRCRELGESDVAGDGIGAFNQARLKRQY